MVTHVQKRRFRGRPNRPLLLVKAMKIRRVPLYLVLACSFSCSTALTDPDDDPSETLRRVERRLITGPALRVTTAPRSPSFTHFTLIQNGEEIDFTRGNLVISKGYLYWTADTGGASFKAPLAHLIPGPGARALGAAGSFERGPLGGILINTLGAWGVQNEVLENYHWDAHVMSTNVTNFLLSDVHSEWDSEGPCLVCRFRIEEVWTPLAKELWNKNFFGGAEMGPPCPGTGTVVQKLWYDPVTFTLKKRVLSGEFALDGDQKRHFEAVTETFALRN